MRTTIAIATAVALIACLSTVPALAAVTARVDLNTPVIERGETQQVYALIRFTADDALPAHAGDRSPLALSLVIDRSGSMEEAGKLEYAKEAARDIVRRLAPTDTLSIVEYDDRVTLAWPQTPVTEPGAVARVIESLQPRGATNLSGGMMHGVAQLASGREGRLTRRVILLSDGLANRGVTNPHRIARLASSAKAQGACVTTMGLGLDYDEDLMQTIAESGGGKYYYIESPAQVASIFRQELDNLFNMVTLGVRVEISLGDHVTGAEVFGYPYTLQEGRLLVEMDDFHAGEERSLLVRLDVAPLAAESASLGRVSLRYRDLLDDTPRKAGLEMAVATTRDKTDIAARENKDVSVEAILITADEEHEEAVRLVEAGQAPAARTQMEDLADKLDSQAARYDDVQLRKKLEALEMEAGDVAQAENDAEYRENYLKKSKESFYRAQKGERGKYLLQEGDSGPDVLRLQKALRNAGVYAGPLDGDYSAAVAAAVGAHQHANHMDQDGVAGPMTLRSLGLY